MSRSQQNADYLSASNYGVKNKIINGNFDVWQRGTSISVTASGTYTADRYVAYYDGTGATRTVSRQAFTVGQTEVPYEPRYFLRYAQTVAGSGAGSNAFVHKIEGARTFAGQTVTISFYAKFASAASINVIAYQAFGTGGSPSGIGQLNFVTGLSVGTTWTKYTYTATIPSISGKTFGTNENDSLDIYFILPINATFTFDIAQIQLEAGSIATPFEQRPFGMELALCQRYFTKSYVYATTPGTATVVGSCDFYSPVSGTGPWYGTTLLPVEMRSIPLVTSYDMAGASGKVSRVLDGKTASVTFLTGTKSVCIGTVDATSAVEMTYHFTASAEL